MRETMPQLEKLFLPRSVAVVGASPASDTISGRPLKLLREFGFSGNVFPVNPKYRTVAEYSCYPDVASLPETPDVVLVGVRASLVPSVMESCAARRVPFAVIFSSGFAESEDRGAQERILAIAREGGVRILGPNCQGMVNLVSRVPLSFSASLEGGRILPGHVAYVSQSGAFGFATFAMGNDRGVRFRYVVTTGNQADLDAIDVGRYVLQDPEVRLLLMYLEGVNDGERFLRMIREAHERRVPVGVLKVGKSPSSRAAVRSHTAALTGDDAVWDAVFRQYSIISMEDAEDIVNLGLAFNAPQRPNGKRVAILTTSGGAGIVTADRCDDMGLAVPPLSETTQEEVRRHIPPFGSSLNPVDMTAQVINDPEGFPKCLRAVLDSPEVDMVVSVHSMITGEAGWSMARSLAEAWRKSTKPLACCWLIDEAHGGPFREFLREQGVPLFQSPRECVRSLAALAQWESAAPGKIFLEKDSDGKEESACPSPLLPSFSGTLTEYDAKRLLKTYGVPITREVLCASLSEARDAAETMGYPVALKVMSGDILHKTEAGVVALHLYSEEELRNAYGRLLERARTFAPHAHIQGVLVQEMVEEGLECLVGVKRDPLFGPIVAVGLGGIYVEVLRDLVLRKAPVDEATALNMIEQLKGYPLLAGARGQKKRDIVALASLLRIVSEFACAEPDLLELDVNPVFLRAEGEGVVAADALVLRRGGIS